MKAFFIVAMVLAGFAASVEAQAPVPPASKPASKPAPAAPAPQKVNIRIDIVVAEEGGTAAPVRKTASVITSDWGRAAVRSQAEPMRHPSDPGIFSALPT